MKRTIEEIQDIVKDRRGMDPQDVIDSKEEMEKAGVSYQYKSVLLIHEKFKPRLQYLGDAFAQMVLRNSLGDDGLNLELRKLATALSYLLNSTSYEDGKLHDFDRQEIRRKLGIR